MKILYITSYPLEYSSSANKRNIALIKGLIANGHKVSSLSTAPQIDSTAYDSTLLDIVLQKRYFISLNKVHSNLTSKKKRTLRSRINGLLYKIYSSVSIYDSRASEVKKIKKIKFDSEKFDIIISSSDPKSSHLFAEELLKQYPNICNKWIQYWGDPFTGDINKTSLLPNYLIEKEEKRLISLCYKSIYVSPFTTEYVINKYPYLSDKIKFIPIGYAEKKYYPLQEKNNGIILSYCGDYYRRDRNLIPLFNTVNHLTESICKLVVAGRTDLNYNSTANNIKFFPRISSKEVEEIESQSDIIVCVCNLKGTQIPGKIYHAAATNRHILIILDGEDTESFRNYFDSFKRFNTCLNNEDSIRSAILRIKNLPMDTPCEELHINNLAKLFLL